MDEDNLIFGTRSAIEAIAAGKQIEKLFVQKGMFNELFSQLRKALSGTTVPIQFVPPEKLKRITEKNHQGVIAYLTEITYYSMAEELAAAFESGNSPLALMLDRITDVRNFGAIAR